MENKTILLNESQLTNLVRKIVNEVKGESKTPPALNFIEYMRRSLGRVYGKSNRNLINDNLAKFIRLIDDHDLKDAMDMFNYKFNSFDPKEIERNGTPKESLPMINRPDDWKQKAQSEFERYYADLKKSNNKLNDPYFESKMIKSNINYLMMEYVKRIKKLI